MLKRGATFFGFAMEWIPKWSFVIIVLLTFVVITQFFVISEVSVADAESIIMAERLVMAQNGIAAADDVGNVRIGRIARQEFEPELMVSATPLAVPSGIDAAAEFPNPAHMGAVLSYDEEELAYQKFYAERYLPLARRGISGPQGAQGIDWQVLALDEDGKAKWLTVTVVVPNE